MRRISKLLKTFTVKAQYFVLLSFMLNFSISFTAQGRSLRAAKVYYSSHDYKSATKALNSILKTKKGLSKAEVSEVYKYLGLSYSMLGKRKAAIHSFVKALKSKSNLTIDAKDLLSKESAENYNQALVLYSKMKNETSDGTKLLIESNLKNAIIAIDGKIVGRTFQKINVKPGINKLDIFVPGTSVKRTFRIPIRAEYVNEFIIIVSQSPAEDSARSKRIYKEPTNSLIEDNRSPKGSQILPDAEFVLKESPNKLRKKPRRNSSIRRQQNGDEPLSWIHFTPFGGGYFHTNKWLLGGVSSLTQVTLAYLAYDSYAESKQLVEDSNNIISKNESAGKTQEEIDKFRTDAEKLIADTNLNTAIYLTGFFLTWGLSALHLSYDIIGSDIASQELQSTHAFSAAKLHSLRRLQDKPSPAWQLAIKPTLYSNQVYNSYTPDDFLKAGLLIELNSEF